MNVTSVNGIQSFPGTAAYCASKAATDMLTKCAAVDLAPLGIRVNSVNPGLVSACFVQVVASSWHCAFRYYAAFDFQHFCLISATDISFCIWFCVGFGCVGHFCLYAHR